MPVLLDFDDTLCEQVIFFLQYARALGDLLAAEYGGNAEEWAHSAADMMAQLEHEYEARFRCRPTNGYLDWLASMRTRSVQLLFKGMGLPTQESMEELSLRMQVAALGRCRAFFPGAIEAVRTLHTAGIPLHMASGNESRHLRAALSVAGLASLFDGLFGPDLVDCAKEGPEFYARIFERLNIAPSSALVIDNDPVAIGWAHAAGARSIQVKLLPELDVETAPGTRAVVTHLEQLPSAVQQLYIGTTRRLG